MNFRFLSFFVGLFLAACQPVPNGYLVRGAGSELDATRAARSTTVLSAYLREMCLQSGLEPAPDIRSPGCPNNLSAGNYKVLLIAGLSEIESGCRAYVQYLFEERHRERRFRRSSSAIQAFVNGVLTLEGASARLFSYLVQTSTFANAFYDASNLDPLDSLELRNINKIINERQTAYRKEALGTKITSRPQLVRTWRRYQWICTPQSILSDFNELTAASIEGRSVDFTADAKREFEGIAALTSITGTGTQTNIQEPTEECPDCKKIYASPALHTKTDLAVTQSELCTNPDGDVGPKTATAIAIFEQALTLDANNVGAGIKADGRLSETELGELVTNGCDPDEWMTYSNYFERSNYANDTARNALITRLNTKYPDDPVAAGASMDKLRAKIGLLLNEFRSELKVKPATNEMTKELENKLIASGGGLPVQ